MVVVGELSGAVDWLLGTELLSVIGGIFAVPAAAVVEVVFMRAVAPLARRRAVRRSTRPRLPDGERVGSG
ncbi:MAG TPA: hypothetical protein VFN78_13875 [Ktedonobacterales bacterium]|nr:hypothetical protein [Ktedonobacterales bacterium]